MDSLKKFLTETIYVMCKFYSITTHEIDSRGMR